MANKNQSLSQKHKVCSGAVAAGQTAINGTGINMSGFESVIFIAKLGAVNATGVGSLKGQASDDDGSADAYNDLAGSAVAFGDTDDGKLLILEVYRPKKKWVRPVVTRGTADSVVDSIIAILTKPRVAEVTEDAADVAGKEVHASPDEGTA